MRNPVSIVLVLLALVLSTSFSLCQESADETIPRLPSVGLGTGLLSFNGDVGRNDPVTSLTKIRFGSNVAVEERLGSWLGISLYSLYGTLAASDRTPVLNRNFESRISQTDIHFLFHFDNGFILKKSCPAAPYLSVGFGYLKFNPYGILKDAQGNYYYYWSDGGIHNAPQSVNPNAPLVPLNYSDETVLTDSSYNYKRYTFSIPVAAGVRLKLAPCLHADLSLAYYFTFSGYIDNYRSGNDYDGYFYASAGLAYNFGWKKKSAPDPSASVDFNAIDTMDSDSDGVSDNLDECPGTPHGISVDARGCPVDKDKDGVPDFRDIEPGTKPGILVNDSGQTLTDEMIYSGYQFYLGAAFRVPENIEYVPGVLPDEFKYADRNNDGYISYDEIISAISDIFDNDNDVYTERVNRLIDYYFLQK